MKSKYIQLQKYIDYFRFLQIKDAEVYFLKIILIFFRI